MGQGFADKYQAVLFDFDGTLADSYRAITASVNYVRAQHHLPPMTEDAVRRLVGHGLMHLMADVVPGGNPAHDAQIYGQHHPSVMFSQTRMLPGVGPFLKQLKNAHKPMAVCSNKPVAITRQLLDALHLSELFDAALGPEDAGKPKPDPAMLVLAMKSLKSSPESTLYVGDMTIDVETGRNAGVHVWVVATGSHDEQTLLASRPDRLFHDMAELAAAFFGGDQTVPVG